MPTYCYLTVEPVSVRSERVAIRVHGWALWRFLLNADKLMLPDFASWAIRSFGMCENCGGVLDADNSGWWCSECEFPIH